MADYLQMLVDPAATLLPTIDHVTHEEPSKWTSFSDLSPNASCVRFQTQTISASPRPSSVLCVIIAIYRLCAHKKVILDCISTVHATEEDRESSAISCFVC